MADEEWTVVGRNNRPRRPKPAGTDDAPAAAAIASAATTAPPPAPQLPGWGAPPTITTSGSKRRSPPTAATTTNSRKRPGRRRERWAAAARGNDDAVDDDDDADDDDGDNASRERRCALHLGLVREAAAEVAHSDMYKSLRAAMASAAGSAATEDDGEGAMRQADGSSTTGFPWASVSELVVYGLGSVEGSRVSRHQAALATLLASPDMLPRVAERAAEAAAAAARAATEAVGPEGAAGATGDAAPLPPAPQPQRFGGVVAYDPCFSRVDKRLLARLGVTVLEQDERCARRAARPAAFFYLPHLEAPLTDGLLEANWTRARLRRTAILGNAFSQYAERWSLAGSGGRGGGAHGPPRRLLALVAAGCVTERRVRESSYGVSSAFNDAALHTFVDASDAAWEAAGVPDEDEEEEED
jgi:hypothetical protein